MTDRADTSAMLARLESRLNAGVVNLRPFPHVRIDSLFDDAVALAALCWMERDARWRPRSTTFYSQDDCTHCEARLRESPAGFVAHPDVLRLLREHVERTFRCRLVRTAVTLTAHRLHKGHRIGMHTDNPKGGTETHRLVVTLNRGFADEDGGHLVLFEKESPEASTVIVRPLHNLAVGLEFSDRSWHMVDEVRHGERFSLLYSFWAVDRPPMPP